MTFGIAAIHGTAKRSRKLSSKQQPRYDCGQHGRLTMAQMVALSGITKQSLQYRLSQGVRGDALVSPRKVRQLAGPMCPVIRIACTLAATFPDVVPSVAQVRAAYPMSKASAERWRIAWRQAQQDELGERA